MNRLAITMWTVLALVALPSAALAQDYNSENETAKSQVLSINVALLEQDAISYEVWVVGVGMVQSGSVNSEREFTIILNTPIAQGSQVWVQGDTSYGAEDEADIELVGGA